LARFWVINGYLSKLERITSNSLKDWTRDCTDSLPCLVIFPTPKDTWINSNKARSFSCKPIWKDAFTL
jgi:hypothetical protein